MFFNNNAVVWTILMLKLALTCYVGPISMGLMKTKGIFFDKVVKTSKKNLGTFFLGHPVVGF